LPSSRDSHAIACTVEVTSMNNKRLYKQVKDLLLGEWLLSQTPAEELDEKKLTTECSKYLGALFMQIKKQFALEEVFEAEEF